MKPIQLQDIDINKINGLGVYELRNLARSLGIPRPTTMLRADLIEGIRDTIREGRPQAQPGVVRGRPPRDFTLNVNRITDEDLSFFVASLAQTDDDVTACCCPDAGMDVRYVSGYVHMGTGCSESSQLIGIDLIGYIIPSKMIAAHKLTTGDFVEAKATFDSKQKYFVLTEILLIDGKEPSALKNKSASKHFDTMEGVRPNKTVELGELNFKLGQRVLIKNAKNFDRIEHIVLLAKQKEYHSIALLIEEVDDTAKYVQESGVNDVYLSKVNFNIKKQVMSCLLALFKAKQLAEQGKNVVLFIDCLCKLFRIYNNSAFAEKRLMLNQINIAPLADLKGYFQSARQLVKGGSLTIVAYTNAPTNAMEEYILNEFADVANVVVEL